MNAIAMHVFGMVILLSPVATAAAELPIPDDVTLDFTSAAPALNLQGAAGAGASAPAPLLAMLQDDIGERGPFDGAWEFILSGTGSSDEDFDNTTFGATFSIGYFFTEALEVALRQSIFVADNGGTNFAGTTRVAGDFHFDLDAWRPFIGASFGATYGDNVDDTWLAGLEGGVKWYVLSQTFIFAMIEWLWFFDDAGDIGDQFDDGQWVYTLGIGFNW
jgi:hypothetical protein